MKPCDLGAAHPLYQVWGGMIQRCTNPKRENYPRYGGAGITVSERWLKFANFIADMGERPKGTQLDRINNSGNYEPGNCRWATLVEQRLNSRQVNNYTHDGRTQCLAHWCIEFGIKYETAIGRLKRGASFIEAMTAKLRTPIIPEQTIKAVVAAYNELPLCGSGSVKPNTLKSLARRFNLNYVTMTSAIYQRTGRRIPNRERVKKVNKEVA